MRRFLIILLLCSSALGQWQSGVKPMLGRQINKTHLFGDFVAAWFFLEGSGNKVSDLSGNDVVGTLSGDVAWISGPSGHILTFPGTNDWIDISDKLPAFGTNDFTVIVKCKHPQDGAHRMLLSKGWTGAGELGIYKHNADILYVYGDSGSIALAYPDPWPDDVWVHIAVVRKGSVLTLYQDTVIGNSDTSAGANLDSAEGWRIGADHVGGLDYNGEIDYVMIYNRALSASEIAELYREPFGMFVKDDIAILVTAAEPPPPPTGQIITIIMTSIPLFLIPFFFIKRRKLCR